MLYLRAIILMMGYLLSLNLALSAMAAEIQQYHYKQMTIHTCHIHLPNDTLRMFWKDPDNEVFGNFAQLRAWLKTQGSELICATNAGIYDTQYHPLGLYVENGVTLKKLNTRQGAYGNFYMQPNGVFMLTDKLARIVETTSIVEHPQRLSGSRFATQSGPIMLRHRQINPSFTPDSTNRLVRNAVCIGPTAQDVTLALAKDPINFYSFAQFLRDQLQCTDALLLDGKISRMYPTLNADFGPDFGAMIAVIK